MSWRQKEIKVVSLYIAVTLCFPGTGCVQPRCRVAWGSEVGSGMALSSTGQSSWAAFVALTTCVGCNGRQLGRTTAPTTHWIWGSGAVGLQVDGTLLKGVQS